MIDLEKFKITDIDGKVYCGGNQYWILDGGGALCGTTTAANIFAYILRFNSQLLEASGVRIPLDTKDGFIEFIEYAKETVFPRKTEFGLMAHRMFEGLPAFAERLMVPVTCTAADRLDVPSGDLGDSVYDAFFAEAKAFIQEGLSRNIPIAFLNLSPLGFLSPKNIDGEIERWHWVTIVGVDETAPLKVHVVDNNNECWADLTAWAREKKSHGSFVRLSWFDTNQK